MTKEKASIHIQTKLTESEYEVFKPLIEITGMKRSAFFRQLILSKNDPLILPKKTDKNKVKLIRLASKTSNNINQIAKQLNSAKRTGIITESMYIRSMNALITIESAFVNSIENYDS